MDAARGWQAISGGGRGAPGLRSFAGCRTRSQLHIGELNWAATHGHEPAGGGALLGRVPGLRGKWESTWLWRGMSFVGSAHPGLVARGQRSKSRRWPGESDTSGWCLCFLCNNALWTCRGELSDCRPAWELRAAAQTRSCWKPVPCNLSILSLRGERVTSRLSSPPSLRDAV